MKMSLYSDAIVRHDERHSIYGVRIIINNTARPYETRRESPPTPHTKENLFTRTKQEEG